MNARAEITAAADANRGEPLVALIGNPNTGKTTLFNQLTGSRARVGNYPGITVERRTGQVALGDRSSIELLDLPGCYSLSARSPEEQIAIEAVLGLHAMPRPDLAVVVVDAGQLIRNLYLVVQLVELQVPLVVALNMTDEVDPVPDHDGLAKLLGVPVVPLVASRGDGVDALKNAIAEGLKLAQLGAVEVAYPQALLDDVAAVGAALPDGWRRSPPHDRALAMWALTSIDEDDQLHSIPAALRQSVMDSLSSERDVDAEVVTARYRFLDEHVQPLTRSDDQSPSRSRTLTEKIDRVALHPVFGFAIFILLMLVVFQALFSWSDPAIGVIETLFGWIGAAAQAHLPEGFVADIVSEGLIGGVGNVIVFLPQILLLFLLLGLLEDSGYMARAAYLMDRVMKALGLHGRAFVPMLSGCACAIPAIMATRTMERERDRLLTMMVVPLMTCSARLPVYTLIIAALFPPSQVAGVLPVQGLLMVFMYLFATMVALAAAGVLGRTVIKGRRMPLLLELPPYRLPTLRSVGRQTLERAGVFLKEAGTVILVCTIALWALLTYPKPDAPQPLETVAVASWQHHLPDSATSVESVDVAQLADNGDAVAQWHADKLAGSLGGKLGRAIEPAIAPLGFDWKLGVGIIGAFAAREVFVSTMGLVYGIGADADEESKPLRDRIEADKHADGTPIYTPLMGLSLMIFFALACQCMSTLAVVKRETRSWKWPTFLFGYMTVLAWLFSFLVYQGGKMLGFA